MQSIHACKERLEELASVISHLSDNEYGMALPVLNHASLGGHTRHIVEFYQCLLHQTEQGEINYDLRNRQLSLERSVESALGAISEITVLLDQISSDRLLSLRVNFSHDSKETEMIKTTLYRELVYQQEHTVHHMALIRVGVQHTYPHVRVPDNFGVAASTLRHSLDSLKK